MLEKEAETSVETQANRLFRTAGFAGKQQELKTTEYLSERAQITSIIRGGKLVAFFGITK
jgi:hypothetical protein